MQQFSAKGFSTLPPVKGRLLLLLTFIILIILLFWIGYHHARSRQAKANQPVPVVLTTVSKADVPVYVSGLGSVTPTYTVNVKTQINGQLLKVLYREGQNVKKGQLMAIIDPRPYQAQLMQFTGQLIRDEALLANSRIDLKRYKQLLPSGAVSKQIYATQVALVRQNEGNVKFDQGQIQTVKVNLIYCYIRSPVDGRVGLRLVDPGNFVQTSDTTNLFVINTLNPITVLFPVPEDNIPEILQQMHAGKKLTVKAMDRWQNQLLAVGWLLTIDNEIDPTTGMVKLRALFKNDHDVLFQGQFVNASLLVKTLKQVSVVPTAAIQHGAHGDFVYLYNKTNNTVSIKPITISVASGNVTAVTAGLAPGQRIVVEGVDKLTQGARVRVYTAARASISPTPSPSKGNV